MNQTASLPLYLVVALSTAEYLARARPPLPIEVDPPLLKILDFGNGAPSIISTGSFGLTSLLQHFVRVNPDLPRAVQSEYVPLRLSFP